MAKHFLDATQREKLHRDGQVKLHPKQLVAKGFSPTSKRYWTGKGTISESQARTKREGVTKAKLTAAHKAGAVPYRSAQSEKSARAASARASRARKIRRAIPDIAPRHLGAILAWQDGGGARANAYQRLTKAQQSAFRDLWDEYDVDDVKEALGYVSEALAA